MKKVLIFGIGGFVGQYLSREFLDYNYEVYGTDLELKNDLSDNVHYFSGDILDDIFVEKLIRDLKPDIIVNLAAISSVGLSWNIPQSTISVNVIGALNIMESVRKNNCDTKILFIGSSEEYELSNDKIDENCKLNGSNPYGISKVTQESFSKLYKEKYNLKIYNVRPFNHTGVGQSCNFVLPSFCKQVADIEKSGEPGTIKVGNIKVKRDFSSVQDIVRAYRMIVESEDDDIIYNVGSGVAYGIDEMLDYIISLSHQKIKVEIDKSRFRPSDQTIVCCDNSLIKKKLGWKPQYTLFEILKEMYNSFLI